MKRINIFKTLLLTFAVFFFSSCADDFLDREPLTAITPETFYTEESQLASFNNELLRMLPSQTYFTDVNYGYPLFNDVYYFYVSDMYTDNQAYFQTTQKYFSGQASDRLTQNGDQLVKHFERLYQLNYFLKTVVPRMNTGAIEGNQENIKHYVGEAYMLRAWRTWLSLVCYGDLPITRNVLPDKKDALLEASKRQPRNEVARWIISDLDSAAMLMSAASPDGRKQRPSKYVAQMIKSRVALFEGTWLKYFSNTPFVPNGPEWPGAASHPGYQFPAGSIEAEMNWFFDQAMVAAKEVADNNPLVENNHTLPQSTSDPVNKYFDMLANATDYSGYSEVLMWREYSQPLGLYHNGVASASSANDDCGMTRALVESFVMSNGLPIYAAGSGYAGDDYIENVPKDRDDRLRIWLKLPNQHNFLWNRDLVTAGLKDEPPFPLLTLGDWARYNTGYVSRKGASQDGAQVYPRSHRQWLPSPSFRSAEAMLNYIEACYERTHTIDGTAAAYWRELRTRAGVAPDYNKTIAATDMAKETATGNWAVYSAGQLVDATLFNIRRERNSEMWGEDLRKWDIRRWRAMDQLINYRDANGYRYHPEGIKIWGPMEGIYEQIQALELTTTGRNDNYKPLTYNTISGPDKSLYIRPYQISESYTLYNGFEWKLAWYLYPIGLQRMLDATTTVGDINSSVIYQNPGWALTAGQAASDL